MNINQENEITLLHIRILFWLVLHTWSTACILKEMKRTNSFVIIWPSFLMYAKGGGANTLAYFLCMLRVGCEYSGIFPMHAKGGDANTLAYFLCMLRVGVRRLWHICIQSDGKRRLVIIMNFLWFNLHVWCVFKEGYFLNK